MEIKKVNELCFDEITENILKELEKTRTDFWNLDRQSANFLSTLIKINNSKNVLEIGTSNGYSGIWILKALLETNVLLKDCFNRKSDLSNIELIEKHLQEYLSTHFILWKARNKEAGFCQSASRIERLIERLKNLKEEATNYE